MMSRTSNIASVFLAANGVARFERAEAESDAIPAWRTFFSFSLGLHRFGCRMGASSLEAPPGSFDFLIGYAFCSRPGFYSRLAILRDDPAGNGMSRNCGQNDCHQHDDTDHLPSMSLTPSHTAPTKPETIMVMTALKV